MTWVLAIWILGGGTAPGSGGATVAMLPGFPSKAACEAAAEKVADHGALSFTKKVRICFEAEMGPAPQVQAPKVEAPK